MKKLLFIYFLFQSFSFAQNTTKPDFRAATWGMSIPAVKATEPSKPFINNDTQLLYKNVPVGQDRGELLYSFDENQLSGASYKFNSLLPNKKAYIDRYERVKAYLTSKYGDPSSSTTASSSEENTYSTMWMKSGLTVMLTMDNSPKPTAIAIFIKGARF